MKNWLLNIINSFKLFKKVEEVNKAKTMLIFQMEPATVEEFWVKVKERNLETEEQRKDLLLEMAKEGKIKSVVQTRRTKEEIVKDYKKNYGNVWDLTDKS